VLPASPNLELMLIKKETKFIGVSYVTLVIVKNQKRKWVELLLYNDQGIVKNLNVNCVVLKHRLNYN
jgi:hypothetical protein